MLRDEAGQQAGFADPSLTLDQDHPGPPGPHRLQLSIQDRQLARPADKMIHPSSVGASGPGRNATLGPPRRRARKIPGPDPSASPSDTAARLNHRRHMSPSIPAPRRATFSSVLRSERIKLTAIRSTLIIVLVSFAVVIGVSALAGYLASSHHVSSTPAGQKPPGTPPHLA